MIFQVSWRVQRDGKFAYLHETTNTGTVIYGPMSRDAVGRLMDERKEFLEAMFDSIRAAMHQVGPPSEPTP